MGLESRNSWSSRKQVGFKDFLCLKDVTYDFSSLSVLQFRLSRNTALQTLQVTFLQSSSATLFQPLIFFNASSLSHLCTNHLGWSQSKQQYWFCFGCYVMLFKYSDKKKPLIESRYLQRCFLRLRSLVGMKVHNISLKAPLGRR